MALLSEKGACERVRKLWEETANAALQEAGETATIDRRSHAARGVRQAPQRHRGAYKWRTLPVGQFADAARQPSRLGGIADQGDKFVPPLAVDDDVVLGQRLPLGDLADVAGEVAQGPAGAGALAQRVHAEGDGGPVGVIGHGLAGEAVEPALDAARQVEVIRVDGQNLAPPQDRVVQPWRQLDLPWPRRVWLAIRRLHRNPVFKLVFDGDREARKPVKADLPALFGLILEPDVGDDQRRGQPFDRGSQLFVISPARGAPQLAQGVVGREPHPRGRLAALFDRVVQVRGGKNDQIPVPDGGDAELGRGVHRDADGLGLELDRLSTALLEGQEGELHDIAVVAEGRLKGAHGEHIELSGFHC